VVSDPVVDGLDVVVVVYDVLLDRFPRRMLLFRTVTVCQGRGKEGGEKEEKSAPFPG
jgi:hypothetical protein